MAGIQQLVEQIPPILTANLAISSPARSLSTCRIYGSNSLIYGTIGWIPPQDQTPFAVVKVQGFSTSVPEPNRIWLKFSVPIFVGVTHADTPFALENFNDQAMQWMDSFVQVIAANRRLYPASLTVSPNVGDVRWELLRGGIREKHPIFDIPYYVTEFDTQITIVYSVNYQP